MFTAFKITAPMDTNGNSRNGWEVWDGHNYLGFVNEQGRGRQALIADLKLNNWTQVHVLVGDPGVPTSARYFNKCARGPQVKREGDNLDNGTPRRGQPDWYGTWYGSHRGWTITGEVIRDAWRYGMPYTDHDEKILDAYLDSKDTVRLNGETVDTGDVVSSQGGLLDSAIDWMNEHIAPEGFTFAFEDGDFGLYKYNDDGELDDEYPVATADDTAPDVTTIVAR